MPTVHLEDRALIAVEGDDAETFLQNVITTDLGALAAGEARAGALLSPQGKILFDFLIARAGDKRLSIELRADLADDLVRRLTLYRLRAKATITKLNQPVVAVSWGDDSSASEADPSLRDTRFPASVTVVRSYGSTGPAQGASMSDWNALRVEHGVAESGSDYANGDAFPHDVLLDRNGGVGFGKGCYIGQEVVSRMQHRGTARRRVLVAMTGQELPAAGTEITANGRAIGTLGTVVGRRGLAIARIDRVKEAVDAGQAITAAGVPMTLAIPAWAGFTFPEAAAAEEA